MSASLAVVRAGAIRLGEWWQRSLQPGGAGMLVLATVVGALAGLLSVTFWRSIAALDRLGFERAVPWLAATFGAPFGRAEVWGSLLPAAGALAMAWFTLRVARTPNRLGVAGLMLDARTSPGALPLRYLPATFVAGVLIIGSGGSAGREAPVVVMGGLLAAWVGKRLGLLVRRRQILIGCGAAAAIAGAFNAPLAGVFFALEVVLEDYTAATMSPVVLASVAGTVVCRALAGPESEHFQAPAYHLANWWEIFLYAGLGVAAGLVAPLFVRAERAVHRGLRSSRVPFALRPAVGGLGVGAIALVLPQVMGNGYEHMQGALDSQLAVSLLLGLVVAKIAATALTLGSGGWGGDFAPLLFVGTMLGGAYGHVMARLLPGLGVSPGAYALVGMGAFLTAAIRCPITAILLLFEITGSYEVVLPIMTACAVATPLARVLLRRGMYHQRLEEMGGSASELPEARLLSGVRVAALCRPRAVTLEAAAPFRDILAVVASSDQLVFPVVGGDGRYHGALTFRDLRGHLDATELLDLVVAADVVTDDVPVLDAGASLEHALHVFAASDLEELPVVEGEATARRFAGLLSRRAALSARERTLAEWEMNEL